MTAIFSLRRHGYLKTVGVFLIAVALIAGVAAISLFVGGIGILAVMLMSVRERTNEIGLRMATGARPRDILVQFLSEATLLGMMGGLAGAAIGLAGSWGLALWTAWETAVSSESIVLSLVFALTVGLFFGVLSFFHLVFSVLSGCCFV